MSELSEILQAINASYQQVDSINLPVITETMSVSAYLGVVDSLHAQALKQLEESIATTIAAGQTMDVSVQLTLLRNVRDSLVDLYDQIHTTLAGIDPAASLELAWAEITNGAGEDPGGEDPGGEVPDPGFVYPDAGTVVLYGDTPMLLREPDPEVPAGARFSVPDPGSVALVVSSPEISLGSDGNWSVGTVTGSGTTAAYEVIRDATIGGVKSLLGELVGSSGNAYAGYSFQAWEAYELGQQMNETTGKSLGFVASGLEVLLGNKSFAEWNAEHDAFLANTKTEYDALAASTLVSKVPLVGWVLAPVVDTYFTLKFKLQHTNSFEISVSAGTVLAGGDKGGILLGGSEPDRIQAGSGDVLASGADGNDVFTAGAGRQYFLGDAGTDTLVYGLPFSEHVITREGDTHTITGPFGTHTASGVERIEFVDHKLAFDLAKGSAAGNAVRLIGAAFDQDFLTPQLVGIGISLFEQGMSMVQVAELAMATAEFKALLGSNTEEQFIRHVYENVMGVAPGTAEIDLFLGQLASHGGSMGLPELLVMAANTVQNAANIDLVGLQLDGIPYF